MTIQVTKSFRPWSELAYFVQRRMGSIGSTGACEVEAEEDVNGSACVRFHSGSRQARWQLACRLSGGSGRVDIMDG